MNIVIPITSHKFVPLRNAISKQPLIEYDFWINEKTLTCCIIPKESWKKPSEIVVVQKSQAKSKSHAKVPNSDVEPKNSKTH